MFVIYSLLGLCYSEATVTVKQIMVLKLNVPGRGAGPRLANNKCIVRMIRNRGAWVAQPVKCLILDFGSGHDLTVCGFEPHVGLCADSVEPAWDSLSVSLPFPCSRSRKSSLSLSLSQEINIKKKKNEN